MTPESLPWRGASAPTTTIAALQLSFSYSQGPRRRAFAGAGPTSECEATICPPRVQVPTKSQSQQQQWQQKEVKSPGGPEPDSSFDLGFDLTTPCGRMIVIFLAYLVGLAWSWSLFPDCQLKIFFTGLVLSVLLDFYSCLEWHTRTVHFHFPPLSWVLVSSCVTAKLEAEAKRL
ncbi:hypothetical protein EDB83DRAFT_311682 [Lactarius deliciosus]|nr:hypothetical protein EDB83DRAFT_311682 [Lactarius deliciosus]